MYENVSVIANRYADLFGSYPLLYSTVGCYSPDKFKAELEPVIKSAAPILVVDVTAIDNEDQIPELCRYMRTVLPSTRIIILAPDLPVSSLCRDLVNLGIYDLIFDIPYDIKARRDKRLSDEVYWAVQNPHEFFEVSKYLDISDAPKKAASAEKPERKGFSLFGRKPDAAPAQEATVEFAPVLNAPKHGELINLTAFDHADAIEAAKRIAGAISDSSRSVLVLLLTDMIRPADVYKLPSDTVAGWADYAAKAEPNETADTSAHWRDFPGLCSKAPGTAYYAVAPALGQPLQRVAGSYDPDVLKPKVMAMLTAAMENFDAVLAITVMGSWLYDIARLNAQETFVLLYPSEIHSEYLSGREALRTSYLIDGGDKKNVKMLRSVLSGDRYDGHVEALPAVIKSGKQAAEIAALIM